MRAMYDVPELFSKVEEDIGINGLDPSADSPVVVRSRFKVKPLEQWTVWWASL